MAGSMKIDLNFKGGLRFEAVNNLGKTCVIDGAKENGGSEDGMRPMELILSGLASCSAFDVVLILRKQRIEPKSLNVFVDGKRADAVPAVFTDINLVFEAEGVELDKLSRAVDLSVEKYCSVSKMLEPSVKITHECRVK